MNIYGWNDHELHAVWTINDSEMWVDFFFEGQNEFGSEVACMMCDIFYISFAITGGINWMSKAD